MHAKDIILIALICVNVSLASTAVVLYVGDAEPVAQAATSNRAGDYIMVTGPISTGREALLIVDVVAQRANLYVPAAGATAKGVEFELKSSRNLAADFKSAGR
ncbi:MAG: hypothetical protein U9R68_09820 [Planctomycetota bacterium]|nr:hypothetical protein [Planctomycetota bacterium]